MVNSELVSFSFKTNLAKPERNSLRSGRRIANPSVLVLLSPRFSASASAFPFCDIQFSLVVLLRVEVLSLLCRWSARIRRFLFRTRVLGGHESLLCLWHINNFRDGRGNLLLRDAVLLALVVRRRGEVGIVVVEYFFLQRRKIVGVEFFLLASRVVFILRRKEKIMSRHEPQQIRT